MVKVKICGLSRADDIKYVNEARTDYVGFVFAKSRRRVDFDTAKYLKRLLNYDIKSVGVFVNEDINFIKRLCGENIVDIIQLHGDEDENYIGELRKQTSNQIIKAVRILRRGDIKDTAADYMLFDTYNKDKYGGTGKSFDWRLTNGCKKPFFLAGGLDINNVEAAIRAAKPFCADISSGVETDGKKDREKIINIINLIRSIDII